MGKSDISRLDPKRFRYVLLKKGEGGLPKDCVANISQIITVDKNDLSEKIGSLKQDKIRLILDGIRLLIEPRTL